MFKSEENVPIGLHTTFGIGGTVRHMVRITSEDMIADSVAFALSQGLPLVLLGEGSNSIFADGAIDAVVMKIEIPGFVIMNDSASDSTVTIGAGEQWDSVVERAVDLELSGIEAMSAIPGTTGATPFQNVGAYGQEIKDTLVSLRAYDTKENAFMELTNAECAFGYRDSIFRNAEKGRYIISSITLKLSKLPPKIPDYPGVKKYFEEKGIVSPTLKQIRDAIIEIRATKLPDPKKVKNVGSFFKNPIVKKEIAEKLQATYSAMPLFPADDGKAKLSAGWLIEHAGLKGTSFGSIGVYANNALVLVNEDNATFADLMAAKDTIIQKVEDTFRITLEPEPIFIQ